MIKACGIKECEFCNIKFEWIFEEGGISKNIKGIYDNGINFMVTIKCPACHEVQTKAVLYPSRKKSKD